MKYSNWYHCSDKCSVVNQQAILETWREMTYDAGSWSPWRCFSRARMATTAATGAGTWTAYRRLDGSATLRLFSSTPFVLSLKLHELSGILFLYPCVLIDTCIGLVLHRLNTSCIYEVKPCATMLFALVPVGGSSEIPCKETHQYDSTLIFFFCQIWGILLNSISLARQFILKMSQEKIHNENGHV
jgi:hypothetical protein